MLAPNRVTTEVQRDEREAVIRGGMGWGALWREYPSTPSHAAARRERGAGQNGERRGAALVRSGCSVPSWAVMATTRAGRPWVARYQPASQR